MEDRGNSTMNSRIVTYAQLVELEACLDSRNKFREVFGEQVEVSVERFSQPDVIAAQFDFDWAADSLLTSDQRVAFYEELGKRKRSLANELGVHRYSDVSPDMRRLLMATLWAEHYVKAGPQPIVPVEELKVEANRIVTEGWLEEDDDEREEREFKESGTSNSAAEESFNGY